MRDLLVDVCDCAGLDVVVHQHLRPLMFLRQLSLETMLLVSTEWNTLMRRLMCGVARIAAVPVGCMTQSYRYWNANGRLRTLLVVRVHGNVVHRASCDLEVSCSGDRLAFLARKMCVFGTSTLATRVHGRVNGVDVDQTNLKIEHAQMRQDSRPGGARWKQPAVQSILWKRPAGV